MRIDRLAVTQFRNVRQAVWTPSPTVNVVYGENAQGKTNLLEALWLFTGGRSFRRAKDKELIAFGEEKARLICDFFADGRDQTAELTIDKRRHATLNGVAQTSASKLTGKYTAVVFSPDHLTLVKEGPEERRRFLDAAICQVKPAYIRILSEYTRILTQRNVLLKEARYRDVGDLLAVFTDRLAAIGALLLQYRLTYVERLQPIAAHIYDGLSGGKERLTLAYEPLREYSAASRDDLTEKLRSRWNATVYEDREAGFTTTGPHREDLSICVNDLAARTYGSQGQQRSAVLSLKMAEASLLKEVTGEYPVVLLDDVMSELDAMRQDYLINHLHDWQVFITCCDPAAVQRMTEGRLFRMHGGCLTEE